MQLNLNNEAKTELAKAAVEHPSVESFLEKLESDGRAIWNKIHSESVSGSQPGNKEAEAKDNELDGPTPAA